IIERFITPLHQQHHERAVSMSNTKTSRNIVLAGESEFTKKAPGGLSVRAEAFRGIEDERKVSLR
ncbi:MAG: hypothetical protein J6W70_00635, partial [Lentisphaeria bacterium]|nr:hypothetical protein [Lentisphaeria bacterium]